MSDLIERLRRHADSFGDLHGTLDLRDMINLAADEITRLRSIRETPSFSLSADGPVVTGEPPEVVKYPDGRWGVEQVDQEGGVCQTFFEGPHAEWRARNYVRAFVPARSIREGWRPDAEARGEAVRIIREWMYERSFKRVRYNTASALLDDIVSALASPALSGDEEKGSECLPGPSSTADAATGDFVSTLVPDQVKP